MSNGLQSLMVAIHGCLACDDCGAVEAMVGVLTGSAKCMAMFTPLVVSLLDVPGLANDRSVIRGTL